jgi:hypothetical protein
MSAGVQKAWAGSAVPCAGREVGPFRDTRGAGKED